MDRYTTQYLYGNPGNPFQLTASRSADNTLTTYSYDTSGNLFAFERAGSRYYVATDHLGTPKVVTDNTGAIVKQTEYDAWGVKLSDSAPTFDLPVGFAGGIPEPVTGLVRFGFRDYEPGTGRWASKDPVLFRGGPNLYVYTYNDPVDGIDRSGLWKAEGHRLLTQRAFDRVIASNRSLLSTTQEANERIDLNQWNGALHAMPGTIDDAHKIITNSICKALSAKTEREAYIAMGEALHTLQDIYSHYYNNAGWWEHILGNPDDYNINSDAFNRAEDASADIVDYIVKNRNVP